MDIKVFTEMFAVPGIFLQAQHQPRTSQGGAGLADGGKGKHTRKLFCTRLEITCQADAMAPDLVWGRIRPEPGQCRNFEMQLNSSLWSNEVGCFLLNVNSTISYLSIIAVSSR